MPVYEYQCQACGHQFERKQSFSDEPIKVCPQCGGVTRKLLSRPAIVFKGSGWYVTDSRPSQPSESGSSSSSSNGGTETKSDTKTETKTKTKSETKSEAKKD
jgi:putative FmdB family regulatory protein